MTDEIWTMKDGTQISVRDMSDLHISNSIEMLHGKIANLGDAEHYSPEALSWKNEFDRRMGMLTREQNRRKEST